MDINTVTYKSLQNYYNILRNVGSYDYNNVYKLLILVFITELLNEESKGYITEEDFRLLTQIIICLSKGTCIIPYTLQSKHVEPLYHFVEDMPTRQTEDIIIRVDQDGILRVMDK